jgi:RNA polymerase primary sigma factor
MPRHSSRGLDRVTPLSPYLNELPKEPLLTAADEQALARAIARGDADARARMIRANLRLVVRIARDYGGRGLGFEDLVGEGNLGLIRAVKEYDPEFGTRFCTYASYWIKQAIREALITTTATIRLPAHTVGLVTRWHRAERDLYRRLGRPPGVDRIAAELGLSDGQRHLVERALGTLRLVPDVAGDDEDGGRRTEEAVDPRDGPDAGLLRTEETDDLYRRLDRLDPRERTIVALRYGLGGGEPQTLMEVGRRLGMTREWVRKIELRAIRKLDDRPDDGAPPPALPARRRRRDGTLQPA